MTVRLVYFAWVRERIGKESEAMELPASVTTAGGLIAYLATLGDNYQAALEFPQAIRVAADHEHIDHDESIAGVREIGLFPPMTGGDAVTAATPTVRVQAEAFDAGEESRRLTADNKGIGAVVTFTGLCRDEDGALAALELEHYPGMAEAQMTRIAALASERFDLAGLTVIHRYGKIAAGEAIVLVIAASRHRQAAFDAAGFIMDILKTEAPFWKKEHLQKGGTGQWVATRDADEAARDKWR